MFSNLTDQQHQVVMDTIKVAPAIVVTAMDASGIYLPDAALAITIIYTTVLLLTHIYTHWVKPWLRKDP